MAIIGYRFSRLGHETNISHANHLNMMRNIIESVELQLPEQRKSSEITTFH